MAPNDLGFFGQPSNTFYRVLTEVIAEMADTGFDSAERLAYWIKRIREAAAQSLTPPYVLERALNETLHGIYRAKIERAGILKHHPGVARFTLERVRPALRAELDRRMMASRELIRLNRTG